MKPYIELTKSAQWPNQLCLDPFQMNASGFKGRIYWVDGWKKTIETMDYIGADHHIIYSFANAFSHNGQDVPAYGLAIHNRKLFFSPWYSEDILAIDTDDPTKLEMIFTGVSSKPWAMAILFKGMQDFTADLQEELDLELCENGRSRCSHLCYNNGAGYACTCPSFTGLIIGADKTNCVSPTQFLLITSIDEGTVSMLPIMIPDGMGGEAYLMDTVEFTTPAIVAESNSPSAVAFDPLEQRIYWSDVEESRIYRQHLNGTRRGIFLQDGIGTVDGITIDPDARILFFTNIVASFNGTSKGIIF